MNAAEVRSSALHAWTNRAREFGVNPDDAMSAAGIAKSRDCQRDSVPLAQFIRVAEYVGGRATAPSVSWLIGEQFDLAKLGEVGRAVTQSRTLGVALRRLSENFELLQDTSRLSLEVNADTATMSYRILDPSIWPRHQDALFSLAIIAKVAKLAVPDALAQAELGFECQRRETGLRMAQSQLSFECEANSIRLPTAMLDAAMPTGTMEGCAILRQLSESIAARRRIRSARERLAEIIFARLSDGDIHQDDLATEIGMSSRTMRRRLAEEETSFQQLLDECRMRQAVLEFQARPEASIAEIALRLGYAEHSTFTRAFTRWAGTPPQRFRSQLASTKH
jgi:AraC-like DNA-binding protein